MIYILHHSSSLGATVKKTNFVFLFEYRFKRGFRLQISVKTVITDCSGMSGFYRSLFDGLVEAVEATKQTAEDNGHVPKTMVFTDLFTLRRRSPFKLLESAVAV